MIHNTIDPFSPVESAIDPTERDRQGPVMRSVAPEDLAPGMYVTVMTERFEWWPRSLFGETCPSMLERYPLRWERPPGDSGTPLRVAGVCLPFVMVEAPDGDLRTLDVRSMSLARFNSTYGREAFSRLARQAARDKAEAKSKSKSDSDDTDDDDDD